MGQCVGKPRDLLAEAQEIADDAKSEIELIRDRAIRKIIELKIQAVSNQR